MTDTSCCCIIPCYNEAPRIGSVLDILTEIDYLDQIICVDDGSLDGTAQVVSSYPGVRLLCLEKNLGKTRAVFHAALATDCEYVLLMDADLKNISRDEIEQAILAIRSSPEVAMLILRRVNKDWITRSLRGDILITGERLLRREDLLDLLSNSHANGYQLEVAINQYMLDDHKTVRWLPFSAVGVLSFKKSGFWIGLKKELSMFSSLFAYLGVKKAIKQYLFLGRKRLARPETVR